MILGGCPGQDKRNIKIEEIRCSLCGYANEIFSDEVQRKCASCGYLVRRERFPSCVDWCAYAKKCVGEESINS